jgi:hypothetical protein
MEQSVSAQSARQSGKLPWGIVIGCGAVLVICACLVLAVEVAYFTGGLQPVLAMLGLAGKAQAATLAPANAPFFMAMELDLQQAPNFTKVWSIYDKSAQARASMDDFRKQFRDSTGCDFDADVAPWWGPDAAIFLTDASNLNPAPTARGATPPSPNFVAAIGTRDQAKAAAALQKCTLKDPATSQETYKNTQVKIYKSGAASAIVANYVLLASTTTAMHAALDASSAGGAATLAQNAKFKDALARLPANRAGTIYADMVPLMKAYTQAQVGIQPQALTQLEAYQTMGGSVAFAENGMRLDVTMTFDPAKLPACTKQLLQQPPNANQALKAAPANAYLFVAGSNVKGAWECGLTQMDAATKKQMQDMTDMLKKQMGVDLDADVFSWLIGEIAFVVTPAQPLSKGMPGVGILALVEAKDPNLVNSKMVKITGSLGGQGLTFKDQNVKGVPMKVASLGMPGAPGAPSIGYGMIGNFLVIGGPLDALESAVDAPKNPLANDATFRAVQATLPAKNSGYYYVNVAGIEKAVVEMLSGRDLANYQEDVQPWLKPVKAIGLAAESGKTDVTGATLFVYIRGD